MKKTWWIMLAIAALSTSCGEKKSADSIKQSCLEDKITKEIYGEQTEEFCNCLHEKISAIQDSTKLEESHIEKIRQTCADAYTTLDTNF